jgi:hypothetical protein
MDRAHLMNEDAQDEPSRIYQANAEARSLLRDAAAKLRAVLNDETILMATPPEAESAIRTAVDTIDGALRTLGAVVVAERPLPSSRSDGPTHQQGQFLAFIREYTARNYSGVAPRHVDFQKFFNLTAPSVNSMLIRLEQRGFIRRIPGKARAIELVIDPRLIPPLDRPFKF